MEGNNNKAPFTGVDTEKASCSSHGDESNIEMQDPTSAAMAATEDPDQHSGCFPVLFRRSKFFPFNPRFDSPHLEEYMESCFFPQSRQKFKSAIAYVIFSCILWVIYFSLTGPKRMPDGWLSHTVGTASMLVISVAYLVLTFFPVFSRHPTVISFTYGLLLATASLLRYAYVEKTRPANFAMTPLGAFSSLAEVVLMMYTLLPLPLYLCSSLAIAYSTLFEILFSVKSEVIWPVVLSNYALHICIHLVCMSVHIMTSVRKHSTFLKIGQSTMARKQLKEENQLQEEMILSLMPLNVAKEVMLKKTKQDNGVSTITPCPPTPLPHLCVSVSCHSDSAE